MFHESFNDERFASEPSHRRSHRAHRSETHEGPAEHLHRALHGRGPRAFDGRGRGMWRDGFFGGGQRARRGDIRSAILALLAEEPMHGYQVISELEKRSDGRWRPSAGSVYPTLQQLEDEGLVHGVERDGRRVFELTDAGKAAAAETAQQPRAGAPWDADPSTDAARLHDLFRQVAQASMQVAQVGSPAQQAEARRLLTETRRGLYRLLAEDEASAAAEPSTD